jgi:hypothetical protein
VIRLTTADRAPQAGASVQTRVNGETTVLTLRPARPAEKESLKRFAVHERTRQGRVIRIIDQAQFERPATE